MNFNDEIMELFNVLIGREVELLSGLEVGGTWLVNFTEPHDTFLCGRFTPLVTFQNRNVRLDLVWKLFCNQIFKQDEMKY